MSSFIKVDNRFFPLRTVAYVDDNEDEVLLSVQDPKTGPGEFRLYGEEAERVRAWLEQRTDLAVTSQNGPQDTGCRDGD